ncbi:MAG: type I restriction enzyme HsdR N-terminal domain-containing protein [Bacteroidales bacterium]|jgi:hypothetical protein|nr:type I restriction enzyme HsdR N-terminal domain-containing protein [Bacteroidales bacterium]
MVRLDFPEYKFRIRQTKRGVEIFDIIRKKFVALTPEEWVRRHVVHFLIYDKNVPAGRMNVERSIPALNMRRRVDVVVFDQFAKPLLVVECKAPEVKITQAGFDQIARYNMTMNAQFLFVTNGLQHFFCQIDFQNQSYQFLPEILGYQTMCAMRK